jgi:hypothetical protein
MSRLGRWTYRDSALLLSGPYKQRSRGPQDWAENISDLTSHKTSDATLLRLCSCLSVGVLVGKPRDFASAACSCGRSCVCNCIWRVAKGLSSAVCSYGDCREVSMFSTDELDRTRRKYNENNFCPSHRPRGTNILAARSRRGSSVAVPVGFIDGALLITLIDCATPVVHVYCMEHFWITSWHSYLTVKTRRRSAQKATRLALGLLKKR